MRSHLTTVRISINTICVIEQMLIRIGKEIETFNISGEVQHHLLMCGWV